MTPHPGPCPLCGGRPVVVQTSVHGLPTGAALEVDAVGPVVVAGARRTFIAEAASRPPALSAWVRACEVSRLGMPMWHGREWDDTGWLVATWDGRWEKVLLCADGSATHEATVTTDPRNPQRDPKSAVFDSPAALQAALDAIADEVPHG